jgi:hypothetical protein
MFELNRELFKGENSSVQYMSTTSSKCLNSIDSKLTFHQKCGQNF